MKAKVYSILSEDIEAGIRLGYVRAFKHNDSPSEESILSSIHQSIMLLICDHFSFNDEQNQ